MKLSKKLELLHKRLWIRVLGALFRNRPCPGAVEPTSVRRVLILRLDRFGDMVVSTPLFRALKQRIPGVEIGVFGGPDNVTVIEHDSNVSKIYRRTRNPFRTFAEAWRARRDHYDVLLNLNLNPSLTGGIIANVAAPSAVKVLGADEPESRAFYNKVLGIDRDLHTPMVDQILKFLDAFGLSPAGEDRSTYLALGGVPPETVDRFLAAESLPEGEFVILNPFAGDDRRRMGRNLAAQVAVGVTEETELPVLLLWAPGMEDEVGAIVEASASSGSTSPSCGRVVGGPSGLSILETALLITRCRFVVSPDTSIVHIADAVGKPVVVIYSDLVHSYREWYPQSVPYRAVRAEAKVRGLDSEEITRAVVELLPHATRSR